MAENENPKGAEQVILSVSLDTQQAEQQSADLGNNLKNLGNNLGTQSVKSFKQQLKEAKEEALALQMAGKAGTAEWNKAVATIAQLKDEMDVLNRSATAFDPGNKFQALNKVASLAASSIGGMTGAMTLLGVSSETANESIAKLQSISAIVGLLDAWGDSVDFLKPFIQRLGLVKATTLEVAAATEVSTVANQANTVAIETQTVATKAATAASKALKVAMASIGIGLLIAAVAYLVENWEKLKKSVTDLFPSLEGTGEVFNKIKNIAVGVGNVVVQYLIAPFKALGKVLKGDFAGAATAMMEGLNVVKNFKSGQLSGELNDAKKKNKEILEDDIKTLEHRVKVQKASGKDTDALERSIFNKKKQLYAEDKEKFDEIVKDKEIFEAGALKRISDKQKVENDKRIAAAKAAADKAKAAREAELKEYEKYLNDASKVTSLSAKNEREKAEAEVRARYKTELDLASKLGKSKVELEKAQASELLAINKKYADDVNAYLSSKDSEKLSSFDKQRKTINDEIDKLKLTASADDKARLEASRINQLTSIDNLETATNKSSNSKGDLATIKSNNASNENDDVEIAKQKITNIRNAEMVAEIEAYNLKKLQLQGQNAELEELEREHSNNLVAINEGYTKANIELSNREKEAKIANANAVANLLSNAASLFGENTIAYKAMAIAQTSIDTYLAAQAAYKSMVGIPIVGPALGAVAAGVAVAGGLANVKKITAVKVPSVAGSSSNGITGGATITAPTINSTILKQKESGISDLTSTVEKKNDNVRAYIVEDDLNKKQEKTDLYNKMSTI